MVTVIIKSDPSLCSESALSASLFFSFSLSALSFGAELFEVVLFDAELSSLAVLLSVILVTVPLIGDFKTKVTATKLSSALEEASAVDEEEFLFDLTSTPST